MDIEVYTIINDLNYHKYTKLINEVCTKVMYIAYQLLYDWPDRVSNRLADHLHEIPCHYTRILAKLFNGPGEIDKIESMRQDKDALKGFDITFLYKLIQFGLNNDTIKSSHDPVWNKNCPDNLKNELEHLLFLLKDSRNEFSHKDSKFLDLTDEDIDNICNIICPRFTMIIREAGFRTQTDQTRIDKICSNLTGDVEKIQNMEEFSLDKIGRIVKFTLRNDFMPYLEEAQPLLETELEKYCPPTLKFEEELITPEQLLSRDYQLICINAIATAGKTSISKYIQKELLSKIAIPDVNLTELEIPLRVICRDIQEEHYFWKFLMKMIPNLRYHVSDDQDYQQIRKFLKHFNIRWIIDGYDEKKNEWFSGFFETLLNVLSNNHKIIITSRPDNLAELRDEADKLDYRGICSVTIECFSVEQIKDFVEKYFGNEVDKVQDFHHSMEKIDPLLLENLVTPENLIAYIQFWSKDPIKYDGSRMTARKFMVINKERQRNLEKKERRE